jgi:rhamnulokinase
VILDRLGVGEELAGQVIPPGYRLGEITHPELPDTGMELVAVSGHDTACVVAAVPSEGTDHVYISAGTWCIVGIESASALLTEEAFRTGFTNERGAGNTYRLLKNIVGLWLVQGLKKELMEEAGYEAVEQLALRVEPGLLINPEDPFFYHPGRMTDAFDAFFQRTGQGPASGPGAYFRCAYQSLGCSIRQHIELLERLTGRSFRTIHMVGGGSQSDFLNQLIADVTNRPVMAGPVEAAVAGNVLNQAVSMGIVEDMETGRKIVGTSYKQKHYVPGSGAEGSHRLYDRYLTMIR